MRGKSLRIQDLAPLNAKNHNFTKVLIYRYIAFSLKLVFEWRTIDAMKDEDLVICRKHLQETVSIDAPILYAMSTEAFGFIPCKRRNDPPRFAILRRTIKA